MMTVGCVMEASKILLVFRLKGYLPIQGVEYHMKPAVVKSEQKDL